jgi:glycosyltransferase involved in cell wall biosynthesis
MEAGDAASRDDAGDGRVNITAVIPTHPPRCGPGGLYERAVASVYAQTLPASGGLAVAVDQDREGAAATRNRALELVSTEWVAFLDSDDEWLPDHLKLCARYATLSGVDVVYPGYEVVGGDDPVNCFGIPFDASLLRRRNFIPVTVLARTELVLAAGGFQERPDENGDPCEDWGLWLAMLDRGATFGHLPQRTWRWHLGDTTRGRPDRW